MVKVNLRDSVVEFIADHARVSVIPQLISSLPNFNFNSDYNNVKLYKLIFAKVNVDYKSTWIKLSRRICFVEGFKLQMEVVDCQPLMGRVKMRSYRDDGSAVNRTSSSPPRRCDQSYSEFCQPANAWDQSKHRYHEHQ